MSYTRRFDPSRPKVRRVSKASVSGTEQNLCLPLALNPSSKLAMTIFVLCEHDSDVTAILLQRHAAVAWTSEELDRFKEQLEWAYIAAPSPELCKLLEDGQEQHTTCVLAGRLLVQHLLRGWTVVQNDKGVAPDRRQLVQEALSLIPCALPETVRSSLCSEIEGSGKARAQRKWLQSFRKSVGASLGALRAQDHVSLPDMQMKVIWV